MRQMCDGFPLFFLAGRQKTKSFVFSFLKPYLFYCHCHAVYFFPRLVANG